MLARSTQGPSTNIYQEKMGVECKLPAILPYPCYARLRPVQIYLCPTGLPSHERERTQNFSLPEEKKLKGRSRSRTAKIKQSRKVEGRGHCGQQFEKRMRRRKENDRANLYFPECKHGRRRQGCRFFCSLAGKWTVTDRRPLFLRSDVSWAPRCPLTGTTSCAVQCRARGGDHVA